METELFCTWKCEVCKEIQPFQEIHKEICEIEKELRPLCESDSVMGLKSLTDFIEKVNIEKLSFKLFCPYFVEFSSTNLFCTKIISSS